MPQYLISYTLQSPGQSCGAVRDVIHDVSSEYARVEDELFRVVTSYSAPEIKLMLLAVLAAGDALRIYTVTDAETHNSELTWMRGAQSSAKRIHANTHLRHLARSGLKSQSAQRRLKGATSRSWR